jgi:hypothetical protein
MKIKLLNHIIITSLCLSPLTYAAPVVTTDISDSEKEKILALSNQVSKKLSRKLIKTLVGDIKAKGFAQAASEWSKSLGILKSVGDSFDKGLEIKRTTFIYRNPDNQPDEIEAPALKYLQEKYPSPQKGAYYIQKITDASDTYYRYYKPMYVGKKCLNCHSETMEDDVKAVLAEKYPQDKAGKMKLGDFRAAIRIQIPAAAIN